MSRNPFQDRINAKKERRTEGRIALFPGFSYTEIGLIFEKSLFFSDFQAIFTGLLKAFSVSVLGAVYFLSI
jgi:hypothetical protein